MFRVTFQNHIQLSQLADGKANMMISINGVIISVVIALVSSRLNEVYWALVPIMVLLIGGMFSLTFAVIASRPRLIQQDITLDDVRCNRYSILFFGHFTRMSMTDFETGMHELMESRNLLYDNMIREIYSMGQVLAKKYQRLKLSYITFLATIALSVITFIYAVSASTMV